MGASNPKSSVTFVACFVLLLLLALLFALLAEQPGVVFR
jgi:hypothetical protein